MSYQDAVRNLNPVYYSTDDPIDRAYAMAVAHYGKARRDRLAHPFGLAEGDPCRFRVSPDVYQALVLELRHPEYVVAQRGDDRLFGLPLVTDPTLPPDSMLLELRERAG